MTANTPGSGSSVPPCCAGKSVGRLSLVIGILLIVLGTIGLMRPVGAAVVMDAVIGWLLIAGGVFWGAYGGGGARGLGSWLKALLLIITGVILLCFPFAGIEVLALWMAAFLGADAVSSVVVAWNHRPARGWGLMVFNGLISAALAVMIVAGWPAISFWVVGIYVSVTLVMNGFALMALRPAVKAQA